MSAWVVSYRNNGNDRPPVTVEAESKEEAIRRFRFILPGVPESEITSVDIQQKPVFRRGWTPERCQFYFEQYNWLKDTGPQEQPFGLEGKRRQAAYREEKGFSFVDPILSNLSLWGGILKNKGYVYRRADGLWAVTD